MRTALFVGCVLGVTAVAAQAQKITLSPSVIELKGTFAQSTTQTLTMTNQTAMALSFNMRAQDVITAGGKRVFVAAGDLPRSIAATAVFSPAQLTVAAGTSRSVVVTVTVPPGTTSRAIVAVFTGTTTIGKGSTAATVSLGTLMTFTLSGQVSAVPSELFVSPQSETRNAAFEVAFSNSGDEPVMPKGIVVILNAEGAIVGRIPFTDQRLLPGERVMFKAEYPGELRRGQYRVLSTFAFSGESLTRTGTLVVQ
jgi:hypothetical protein